MSRRWARRRLFIMNNIKLETGVPANARISTSLHPSVGIRNEIDVSFKRSQCHSLSCYISSSFEGLLIQAKSAVVCVH